MFGRATIRLGIGPHSSFFVAPPTEYIGYCFACYLTVLFCVCVFKRKFKTLNSLFLTAGLTHQKENHKLPGRV